MSIFRLFQSLRHFFRRRRYQVLRRMMKLEAGSGFIMDLGGGPDSFLAVHHPQPEELILLDIDPGLARQAKQLIAGLNVVIADGEYLPFARQVVSLTVCNSVIEHVSSPERLAAEIERVSEAYFVQTPNGHFPLETHSFIAIPFYHWIPWPWLQDLACRLFGADGSYVTSVRYLPENELTRLFPDAALTYETFLGLKKSFYLVRPHQGAESSSPAGPSAAATITRRHLGDRG